jgi:hypothetical protein
MTWTAIIEKLCSRQDELEQQYLKAYYSMDTSNPLIYCRYKASSAKDIAAGEKFWRQKYPPSYRAFLKLQNGWLRFGAGWTLVGAPRKDNKKEFAMIKKTLSQVPVVANEQERAELAEKEKRDPKLILPTNHIVLGTDFNYNLLVFDRHRVSKTGEPEIARTQYGTHVNGRWENFEAFLKDTIVRTEKGLATVHKHVKPQ